MHFKYGDGCIKKCCRTNKNGTRRYFWRGRIYINKKQIAVYGKTQAECLEKLKKLRSSRKTTSPDDDNAPLTETFSRNKPYREWLSQWVTLCKQDKVKNTYMPTLIKNVSTISQALGNYKLKDIKPLVILSYIKSLPRRNLTIKLYDIINGSLQKAEDFGIIGKNPCRAVERPTYEKSDRRAFELNEQAAILHELEGKHRRAFFFLCATGLRIGEFLALDSSCIDFKRGIIRVKSSMNISTGEIVTPKTKTSVRNVFFIPQLFEVFDIDDLGCYTYSGIKKAFGKAYKKLGLKDISMTHSCRHTYASMLCATGLPVKIIQTQLGHAAFSTTMDIYTDVLIAGSGPIYDYMLKLKEFIRNNLL